MADSISARFGGRDVTFKIERVDLPVFEGHFGSAFALFQKLSTGVWTTEDVRRVLSFAATPTTAHSMARHCLAHGLSGFGPRPYHAHVDDTLQRNAPGTYAALASLVLGAALFGVSDDEATFTDENVQE